MTTRAGFVALIGEPNAGKSTLLNRMVGAKVSIVTHKVQTTRARIRGVALEGEAQIVFVDTPGLFKPRRRLDRAMVAAAWGGAADADIVVMLIEAHRGISEGVKHILESLKGLNPDQKVALAINKIDKVSDQEAEVVASNIQENFDFDDTLYVSALNGKGLQHLMDTVKENIKAGPPFYPKDMLSEQPVRFFVAEMVREQLFLLYHQEIPYSATIEIVQYDERDDLDYISADIIVNRESQKGILIGKGGKAIKNLGKNAREVIEDFVDKKVYLDLHVKVREKWREDPSRVRHYGYGN